MTTTQYRNFVAVAECRSITGAAKELLIAQPALTNQIKRMEEEVGVPLFIRYPRSVELTDAGKVFYRSARSILQIEENMGIEISNLSNGDAATLRLGISLFMPDPSFRKILLDHYRRYPDVMISLHEKNTDQILEELESGIVELAAVSSPKRLPPKFRIVATLNSHLYACHTPDSPFLADKAPGEPVDLSELEGIPLSAPRSLYRYIEEFCNGVGFVPLIKAISDSRHATFQLAECGNMVAILAIYADAMESNGMIYHPIRGEDMNNQRYFAMLQGRTLSTAAQNFVETLKSQKFYTSANP